MSLVTNPSLGWADNADDAMRGNRHRKAERRLIDKLFRIWKTFLFQRCFVLQHATRTLLCKSCNKRGSRHPVIAFWNRYRDIVNDGDTANLHRQDLLARAVPRILYERIEQRMGRHYPQIRQSLGGAIQFKHWWQQTKPNIAFQCTTHKSENIRSHFLMYWQLNNCR